MDAAYFRRTLEPFNQWYSIISLSFLGTISSWIILHHNLDVTSDRFGTNFYQKEEVFDFVIGEKSYTSKSNIMFAFDMMILIKISVFL